MKKIMSYLAILIIILFCNISFAQEEQYTFSAETVDTIIVDAEKCISTNKNLSICEDMVKLAQEKMKMQEDQLIACEAMLSKKDQLYGDLSKIKDDQLRLCEEASKKKDGIIQDKQKILDDIQKAIDKEKNKGWWSRLWSNIQWTTVGAIIGAIAGAIAVAVL